MASRALVEVAEASWGQPAVAVRCGVGYESVVVTPANLRAVGFADLAVGSAFLEERWLTDEMADGARSDRSDIHAAAAEMRLVVLADGVRHEVDRVPDQLPASDAGVPRTTSDPLWLLDLLLAAEAAEVPARVPTDADHVAWLPQDRAGRWATLRGRRRDRRQLLVWTDEMGRAARIALGQAFRGDERPLWWIVEFGPYAALTTVIELHEGLPAATSA